MNKQTILDILNKYNFDKQEFIILSGASLVLQDVKEETRDIDITVSEYLYNRLLNDYNCIFEKEVDNYLVWFIDEIINFSTHYYDEIEYIDYNGYKIQSLESILKLKESLNRNKDKNDIEKIKKLIKK